MKKFFLILSFIITSMTQAQVTEPIKVIANVKKDKIQIRWAPTSYEFWQLGNKNGYKVEKFLVINQGVFDAEVYKNPKTLIESSRPLPVNSWDEVIKKEPNAQIVKSMIYEAPILPPKSPSEDLKGFLNYTKIQNNRFGFALFACDMSTTIAQAHGLFLEDKQVKASEKYAYRISIKAKNGKKDSTYSASILVGLDDYFDLPKPRDIQIEAKEKTALISWNVEYDKGLYTGYFIERSEDAKNFKRVNESPYVQMKSDKSIETKRYYYEDSLNNSKLTYSYRIIGMTPFGENSPVSDVVKAKGKDALKVWVGIDTSGLTKNNSCFIRWSMLGIDSSILKGFRILRAKANEGIYERIGDVDKSAREFIDAKPMRNNYYIIEAYTDDERSSTSISSLVIPIDSIPPLIPKELKAKVEKNGVVYLTWEPNTDEDIYGYRVYRINNTKEEPVEYTKVLLNANLFIDTLDLGILSKQVYYLVTAVDMNYNPSNYSEPLLVKRPDTIPPAPAHVTDTRLNKYQVIVTWKKSYSDDVEKYYLYRSLAETQNKVLLDSFDKDEDIQSYIDSSYEIGSKYRYTMEVVDDSKNISSSMSGIISTEVGVRRPIRDLKVKLDEENKKVKINWKYEGKERVESFIIYRQKNKEGMQTLEAIESIKSEFEDTKIVLGNEYTYCIKANLDKDLETELSKKITIIY